MKFVLALTLLLFSSVAMANDMPNLTLKVHVPYMKSTIQFDNCYSFVNVDVNTGIAVTFCENMQTVPAGKTATTRNAWQHWQFNSNLNDVQGFESSDCFLISDQQNLGLRTISLSCSSIQQYNPNQCGPQPCP